MENSLENDNKYQEALKRVKKIKGFYIHASIYVVINIMIFIANIQHLDPGEGYFQWKNFATAISWGVGLLAHGLAIFMPLWILGNNWEERKIKELMEKEKFKL